ncbi:MAG: hypothetical protein Q9222_005862 [Ikaeria aurantiellina]
MADGQAQPKRCNFFLWDDEAKPREAAAVLSNSRTEPLNDPHTPTKPPQTSSSFGLPTPYTDSSKKHENPAISTPYTPSKFSRAHQGSSQTQNTATTASASDEEFFDWPVSDEDDVLSIIDSASSTKRVQSPETPRKVAKLDAWSTPSKRRFSEIENGPDAKFSVIRDVDEDIFVTPATGVKQNGLSRNGQATTSSINTPTPTRFKNVVQMGHDSDLTLEVLKVLQDHKLFIDPDIKAELKAICDRHSLATRGIVKGREISRAMVNTKATKIAELQENIAALQAERETTRAVIRHLRRDLEATNGHKR